MALHLAYSYYGYHEQKDNNKVILQHSQCLYYK